MDSFGGGFSNHVNKLFNDPDLSDVTIVLDNDEKGDNSEPTKTFHGHRVILATMSDYFRSMLYGSFQEASKEEIRLPGVPYSTFISIMQFVYYGWARLNVESFEEAVRFYALVRMFLMDSKMKTCFEKCMLRQMEAVETWKKDLLKVFAVAFEWDMDLLKKVCNSNLSETANEYLADSSFLELPLGAVRMIVNTPTLCCTRAELQQAVQAWINHHGSEVADDDADELNGIISKFKKLCYRFNVFTLYRKKAPQEPDGPGQTAPAKFSVPMEAVHVIAHEYSYKSEMKILKCFALKGIIIRLKVNPKFAPQYGRIKSELEMNLNISSAISPAFSELTYSNSCTRNLTVRYDFTQQKRQSLTIFFPVVACCKDAQVTFNFSWKGSGVQPILKRYGAARVNQRIETDSSYVTHIIYQNRDDYDSDGRCPLCPGLDESDRYSSSSYYESSDDEEEEDEQSENGNNED